MTTIEHDQQQEHRQSTAQFTLNEASEKCDAAYLFILKMQRGDLGPAPKLSEPDNGYSYVTKSADSENLMEVAWIATSIDRDDLHEPLLDAENLPLYQAMNDCLPDDADDILERAKAAICTLNRLLMAKIEICGGTATIIEAFHPHVANRFSRQQQPWDAWNEFGRCTTGLVERCEAAAVEVVEHDGDAFELNGVFAELWSDTEPRLKRLLAELRESALRHGYTDQLNDRPERIIEAMDKLTNAAADGEDIEQGAQAVYALIDELSEALGARFDAMRSESVGDIRHTSARAAAQPAARTMVDRQQAPGDLISQAAAANLCECDPRTITRRINDGTLVGYGSRGSRQVSKSELMEKRGVIRQRKPRRRTRT